MNGTRMPPSSRSPFTPRQGSFLEVFCPYSNRASGWGRARPVGPPLSLRKNTSVFSSSLVSRSFASTRPTFSSSEAIMPSIVRRCRSGIWAILGQVLRLRLHRPVRRHEGEIQEEGLALCRSMKAHASRPNASVEYAFSRTGSAPRYMLRRNPVFGSGNSTPPFGCQKVSSKPRLYGRIAFFALAQMPFADHAGGVARSLEVIADGRLADRQACRGSSGRRPVGLEAEAVLVAPVTRPARDGQHCGAVT